MRKMPQKSILSYFNNNDDTKNISNEKISKISPVLSKKRHRITMNKSRSTKNNTKILKIDNHLVVNDDNLEVGNDHLVVNDDNLEVSNEEVKNNEKIMVKDNEYNPSLDNYHVINDACWLKDKDVPFIALCNTFKYIENTSSRLKMISILTNYFHSILRLSPNNLLPSIYICLNKIGPSYEGQELGIGDSTIISVLAECCGIKTSELKKKSTSYSDLGVLAQNLKSKQSVMIKHQSLTILSVFELLKDICNLSGTTSVSHKKNKIRALFVASKDIEIRYLIRSLQKKLRIGLAEQSIIIAIAHAFWKYSLPLNSIASKEDLDIASLTVKTAFCELPNYDIIINTLLKHGLENLHKYCSIQPGIPVKPMLANSSKSIEEILKRFENETITCEFKYDGERAQIHCDQYGNIKIFSRNQENSTNKYPDIVSLISSFITTGVSFIIDSEVVAFDAHTNNILPFQQLTTRKRKNVEEKLISVNICIFIFDILYLNNVSLVKENYRERRSILHNTFKEIPNKLMFAKYKDISINEDIEEFLDESIKNNCEGLIIKTLDNNSTYEISKRSHSWRKLKKDYIDSLGDSFDLLVIGAYLGTGKRQGVYGGYLLATYDPDLDLFQSICKIGTGFSQINLSSHYDHFQSIITSQPHSSYRYPLSLKCDHWFQPCIVWEIRAADISLSPIHQAAFNNIEKSKGLSLRFPRFLRERTDKKPYDITNIYQIIDIYKNQQQIKDSFNSTDNS